MCYQQISDCFKCLFCCDTNVDKVSFNFDNDDKLSLKHIESYINLHYKYNCKRCKNIVFNKIKKRYHCNIYCVQDDSNIIIQTKISNNDLLSIIKNVYPFNCQKCNNAIFNKLTKKYYCILHCESNMDNDDINFIKSQNYIDFPKVNSYVDAKYIKTCYKCKKNIYDKMIDYLYKYIVNNRLSSSTDINHVYISYDLIT
jgi:hypothetical protein